MKDLGVDVDSATFITEAQAFGAKLIGLSALMSTTMPYQKEVIEFLEAKNLRGKFKVMIGGGPAPSNGPTPSELTGSARTPWKPSP